MSSLFDESGTVSPTDIMSEKVIHGNANMTIGGDASVLMSEKVAHLEELLREKERTIQILMEERRQAPPRT